MAARIWGRVLQSETRELESAARHLGNEIDDALEIFEQTDVTPLVPWLSFDHSDVLSSGLRFDFSALRKRTARMKG